MRTGKKARAKKDSDLLTPVVCCWAPDRHANTDLLYQHLDREEHHKCKASWALKLWGRREEEGKEPRTRFGLMLKTMFELVL